MKISSRRGFTLIEVLLVVVIIAILAGIVIIAVNPARQIAQTNNAQRNSDIVAILDAVHQYAVDHRGALPTNITGTAAELSSTATDVCVDLVPTYLSALPFDPTATGAAYTDCDTYATGYTIMKDANNRVTVAAPGAELSATISVSR
ncbi:MAG: type II secretion system protein [Candidatus Gracilibacteria bacterium]|jgi:type IV pilus assembly protein PilA